MGPGPSSSHTIGPHRIAMAFKEIALSKKVVSFEVTLYGSLAFTGRGHMTDKTIIDAFLPYDTKVIFDTKEKNLSHPNTMRCKAIYEDGTVLSKRYISLGGGAYQEENKDYSPVDIYPFTTFNGMKEYMKNEKIADIYELIERIEGKDIFTYGNGLLLHSFNTIEESLKTKDVLPGSLKLTAVSGEIYKKTMENADETEKRIMLLTAYAYATAEANARGMEIVTNPTCGSAGVVPAVLYYEYKMKNQSIDNLTKAYLVGALICNFIKENASVSGALLGCQAEIGSASSFASASLSYLHGLSLYQIEYAAEVSMEHFLGLTCDPVDGYVQIPCIERNGIAAIHAYSACLYSKNIAPYRKNRVTFDTVIQAMNSTGNELPSDLKETSLGGLAKFVV